MNILLIIYLASIVLTWFAGATYFSYKINANKFASSKTKRVDQQAGHIAVTILGGLVWPLLFLLVVAVVLGKKLATPSPADNVRKAML